ncbi:phosphoribosylanthranilate isomerase [Fluviicoccus keumensis]|uniref:N-(5'-phosphoribosyl)anthranilate isomerase n=1 Tax=Fluviicoccus keumensis TaxID=1435465 RepID=A0A4Q7Z8S8_9GAMM|nr:phosphoribosylanthranilate isomerase [Fluviicoccus keumensis]RZU46878.1 phosphoribosylanthranilate isomerase [Fluviicoccus keumensis]
MSYRTRVKICGITRLEDALDAVRLGADALGFVFYPPSPRYVAPEKAAEIIARLPPFVTTTGLFVDADAQQVRDVLATAPLGLLQFHGDESPEYCAGFRQPWIKALRMQPGLDVAAKIRDYRDAAGILLDAWHPQLKGGTGETFDWRHWPKHSGLSLILAGGLTPENVAEAIHLTQPYAVDVSGGVELGKGLKDFTLMQAFMAGVNAA